MLDDFNTDLFGNVVLPSLNEVSLDIINDFDLAFISKRKLTSDLKRSLDNDYHISDIICRQLFPRTSYVRGAAL